MTFSLDPAALLLLALRLALLGLLLFDLVDAARQPSAAFPAAGKLTKPAWCAILGVALVLVLVGAGVLGLLGLAAAVAGIVYAVDVRPAVRGMRPGAGPWG